MTFPLILLAVLIFFSAFFSGAEIAFMSLSDLKVRHLFEQKVRNSGLLTRLKSKPHKLLVTVLIGNNLANVGASAIATSLTINILNSYNVASALSYGAGISTGIMTILILLFGEIYPKTFCMNHAERVALTISPLMKVFQLIFSPIAWFINLSNRIGSGDTYLRKYPLVTEEEVRTIVKIGEEEGVIKQEEKEIIHNVFELDNTEVAAVMTPRLDMFTFESEMTIGKALKARNTLTFSRIPVHQQSVDKILGVVYVKDILQAGLSDKKADLITSIMKPAVFVPENMMVDALLRQFKKEKNHMALVVDEHGGIAGLVTFEDVLEELVGEIYDETDPLEQPVKRISDDTFKISAKLNIHDANELLDLNLEDDDAYDTISGLILFHLGHIPEKGETVEIDSLKLTVNEMQENRITEVIIQILKESKPPAEPE